MPQAVGQAHRLLEIQTDRFLDIRSFKRRRLVEIREEYEREVADAQADCQARIERAKNRADDAIKRTRRCAALYEAELRGYNAEVNVAGYPQEATPELVALAETTAGQRAGLTAGGASW